MMTGSGRAISHRSRLWLYALSAVVLLFLVIPTLIVVPMSFSDSTFLEFPPRRLSLRWYEAFFGRADWVAAMWVSLKVAALTVTLSVPVGVAAAYALHVMDVAISRWLLPVLIAPMLVPHILVAVGLFFVYVPLGLNNTIAGLALAHAALALPFVVVVALAGLRGFDLIQEKAARSLGASRFIAFMRVVLPQIRPSVLAGALFAFVTSFDEVIVAFFLSTGGNSTLPRRMFLALRDTIDPTIAAISTAMVAISVVIAFFVQRTSAVR